MTDPLYPFLSVGAVDEEAFLAEVERSTVDKIHEVTELRSSVLRDERERLLDCARALAERVAGGARLLVFGNGGSSTDAQDLASLFLSPPGERRPVPAFCLTNDIAVITALTNDVGFDVVFSRQIAAFGRPADIAVGLSTSGNSANLLPAFRQARTRGMLTVGFAGADGGQMAECADIDHLFVVPSQSVHRIQETQTTLYHVLWELTLAALESL